MATIDQFPTIAETIATFNNVDDALEEGRVVSNALDQAIAVIDAEELSRKREGLVPMTPNQRLEVVKTFAPRAQDLWDKVAEKEAEGRRVREAKAADTTGIQVTVTHRCGHEDETGTFYPHTSTMTIDPKMANFPTLKAKAIAKEAERFCPACRRAYMVAQTDNWDTENIVPELTARSDAQLQYARSIRRQAITHFRELAAGFRDDVELAQIWQGYEDRALQNTDAGSWCEIGRHLPAPNQPHDQTILAVMTLADEVAYNLDLAPLPQLYG